MNFLCILLILFFSHSKYIYEQKGDDMKKLFSDVVEEVKQLDPNEKLELKSLLDKYLIDERRHEIFQHYELSQREETQLDFSSDVDELRAEVSE